jgi:hypothetical protein
MAIDVGCGTSCGARVARTPTGTVGARRLDVAACLAMVAREATIVPPENRASTAGRRVPSRSDMYTSGKILTRASTGVDGSLPGEPPDVRL